MKTILRALLVVAFCVSTLATPPVPAVAQSDVVGTWQGRLMIFGRQIRRVLKIERNTDGTLSSAVYSPDETDDTLPVETTTLDGATLKLTLNVNKGEWQDYHRSYSGTLAADGNAIDGKWSAPGGGSFQMNFVRATPATAWAVPTPPATQLVSVDKDVQLEVVDWGGSGTPIVFLAGLGNTAHIFSSSGFARSFTHNHHVYGITRRGFGESSKPALTADNYSARRLGDDIVAVIDALHIERPALIGHSIAGEELSAVGTYHPEKVSGLVYLDAGYSYALYDPTAGSLDRIPVDAPDFKDDLAIANSNAVDLSKQQAAIERLLKIEIPRLQRDLRSVQIFNAALAPRPPGGPPPGPDYGATILAGAQKFTGPINVPILAIFASPHNFGPIFGSNKGANAAAAKLELADSLERIHAFQKHLPTAKVIRIPNADHYVFVSNTAEVQRDVNAFLDALPKSR